MARDLHAGVPVAVGLAAAATLLLPAAAEACAACGAGTADRSANAFAGITALLSLLPLGMIGAGLWWTRRSLWSSLARDSADRASDAREGPVGDPPSADPGQ